MVVRRTLRPLEQVSATALHVSELPLTAADTVLPGTIAPADPTSEVDQVSVAFDHMLEHVRSALTARDTTEARLRRFVADASHELRTPLATIRAHAEYAGLADGPLPAQVTHALSRITAATDRMGTLVADLLLLARLDAGRPLARDPVDLTRLVLDAVVDARAAGPDHRWKAISGRSSPSPSPATANGCTRCSPTCSPTPAPTPRRAAPSPPPRPPARPRSR